MEVASARDFGDAEEVRHRLTFPVVHVAVPDLGVLQPLPLLRDLINRLERRGEIALDDEPTAAVVVQHLGSDQSREVAAQDRVRAVAPAQFDWSILDCPVELAGGFVAVGLPRRLRIFGHLDATEVWMVAGANRARGTKKEWSRLGNDVAYGAANWASSMTRERPMVFSTLAVNAKCSISSTKADLMISTDSRSLPGTIEYNAQWYGGSIACSSWIANWRCARRPSSVEIAASLNFCHSP